MISIVVDSNSQMPASLVARYGIRVVPLTVTVDGVDHLEGLDLTNDQFYDAWGDGHSPTISTSQPSPGQFVDVYQAAIDDGATEILSIHLTETMSGTLNSARLAAATMSVPVRLVDSGTASFGISCCAWAAADSIQAGADLESAAVVAEQRAAQLGTAFIVGVPTLASQSGRVDGLGLDDTDAADVPVLSMSGGEFAVLATASTIDEAVAAMVAYALEWTPTFPDGLRIAVGTSDATSGAVSAALTEELQRADGVGDIVQYTIGPSVGAHTGPGTAGLFVF